MARARSWLFVVACFGVACGDAPGGEGESSESGSGSDESGASDTDDELTYPTPPNPLCEGYGHGSLPLLEFSDADIFGKADSDAQSATCTVSAASSDGFTLDCDAVTPIWSVTVSGMANTAEPLAEGSNVEVQAQDIDHGVVRFRGLLVQDEGGYYFGLTEGSADVSTTPPGLMGAASSECVENLDCPTYWGYWRFETPSGEEIVKSGQTTTVTAGSSDTAVPIRFWGGSFVNPPPLGEPFNCAEVTAHSYAAVRAGF